MGGEEVARVKVELFDDSESNRNDDDVLSESKDSRVTMEEVTMRTMAHAVKEEMDDDIVNWSLSSLTSPKPMEGLHKVGPPPFLKKTFEMVEDPHTNPIVSWSQTRNSFIVWDSHDFSKTLVSFQFPKSFPPIQSRKDLSLHLQIPSQSTQKSINAKHHTMSTKRQKGKGKGLLSSGYSPFLSKYKYEETI